MTDAMKIEMLKEYGIIEKSIVMKVVGMRSSAYEKAIKIKTPSYYNGMLDHTIVFEKKWFKRYNKSPFGVSLREQYVVPFIKANKGKYTIHELGKLVILGQTKVPAIIMGNNLYDYMKEKERSIALDYKVIKKRYDCFIQNKNDKTITDIKLGTLIGCSAQTIYRMRSC